MFVLYSCIFILHLFTRHLWSSIILYNETIKRMKRVTGCIQQKTCNRNKTYKLVITSVKKETVKSNLK